MVEKPIHHSDPLKLPLHEPPGVPAIIVRLDIVPAHVPALLGLDVLDLHQFTVDTVFNILAKRIKLFDGHESVVYVDEWPVPVFCGSTNHVYVSIGVRNAVDVFFTCSQLGRLHRHFFHPSIDKWCNLLLKARTGKEKPRTKAVLQEITKQFDPCQRIQNVPKRFEVSFGMLEARLNERELLEVMPIDGKKVLQIVDEGTRFSAARFLEDESTARIWNTLI